MNTQGTLSRLAGLAAVTAIALGAAGSAQAHDNVAFSVGIAAPGVQLAFSNRFAAPLLVAPPVLGLPRPVAYAPAPVYYYSPSPVVYGYPGWRGGRFNEHEGWRGHEGRERFEHGRGFGERFEGHRR